MKRRAQRGMIDNRPLLWIVPILVLFGWYNWPGGPPDLFGIAAITWITWIAWIGGGLLALLVIGGFVARRLEVRQLQHMNEVARALDSRLELRISGGWGRSTASHFVSYGRGGRTVTVDLTSGGTATTLDVAGAKAAPFSLTFHDGAETVTEHGAGASRAEQFLDPKARTNLARMEAIGEDHYRAVTVHVTPASVTISKHGRMSPRETLLFLNLCWPVFDRALAVCFGQTVRLPEKACPTCGGECCPTFDVAHAPGCGCA